MMLGIRRLWARTLVLQATFDPGLPQLHKSSSLCVPMVKKIHMVSIERLTSNSLDQYLTSVPQLKYLSFVWYKNCRKYTMTYYLVTFNKALESSNPQPLTMVEILEA